MKNELSIVVFAYNFPHRKTQDFLHRLFVERAKIVSVLAADPVSLGIPPSSIRLKPRYGALVHPRAICEACQWPYYVVDHRGEECRRMLETLRPDVGIVAGARILTKEIISLFRLGIINFHPGILPAGRGLDALQWALVENRPIGVTAHFINEKVDSGRIILTKEIALLQDESLVEVSMRLHDLQLEMLPEVLSLASRRANFPLVGAAPLHRKMPAELELQVPELYRKRLQSLGNSADGSAPRLSRNSEISGTPVFRT